MRAKGAEMGEGEGEEGGMKGERGGREQDHEKRGEGKGVRTPLGGQKKTVIWENGEQGKEKMMRENLEES